MSKLSCAFCLKELPPAPYWERFCDSHCAVDFNTGETDRRPFVTRLHELDKRSVKAILALTSKDKFRRGGRAE